jgi:protein-S-isoprenylcysteine O-methyltransferase Ste14
MRPAQLLAVAWIAWIASWMLAAFWSARTEKRAATRAELTYRAITVIGILLMVYRIGRRPAWPLGDAAAWALVCVAVGGLLFTWWARIHIGRLWSSTITRKEGHRIVESGPYALVRHPIYTGIITAILASAAARARATSLAGAALLVIGFWLKARAEEKFLAEQLGQEAYAAYRRRVPMLAPFPWPRR